MKPHFHCLVAGVHPGKYIHAEAVIRRCSEIIPPGVSLP